MKANKITEGDRIIRHSDNKTEMILLRSGATVQVPNRLRDRIEGVDEHGNLLVRLFPDDPSYLVPLTPCCHADGKGSASPTGMACRACYSTVDAYFGGPAENADPVARTAPDNTPPDTTTAPEDAHVHPHVQTTPEDLLRRTVPMLVRLGDFIGNGPVDPNRPGSTGTRCDLLSDIRNTIDPPREKQ